jgi:cytochrome c oxidase subunit I
MATALTQPGVEVRPEPTPFPYPGLWGWITSIDHKRIGILYGVTAFIFFLVGGFEALLVRTQLAVPRNTFVGPDAYNQLFTMHGTTMVFLVIMPLSVAFFNFVVPLQIGARDVAFPRLNAFSYWLFLFGGIILNLSWFFGGAPDMAWVGYSNLTSLQYSPGHRVDFWIVGIQMLGVASLAGAFNFIVTIINLRAPGMSLMRMPIFTWNTLVTAFLLIFAMPPIAVALIFLMFDRMFGTHFYLPQGGGDPVLWQHLFWIFGHPEVYILILPAMGMVSEVLPVFSRKPLFGYAFVVYATVAIAFLGFGVWSHHMFTVGMGAVADAFFAVATMLISIPTGIKIFNWIGTMWKGQVRFTTPMLMALGFVSMFILGGITGIMHASVPVDTQQHDTYFIVAHFHYVLFGGAIHGLFAGIYFWFPKYTGRMYNETLGKIQFWMMFIGFNLTFFPMHFLGIDGMPRRIYTYGFEQGWAGWNLVATIGAYLMGASIMLFVYNALTSLRKGQHAPGDPWDAATLEWSISSPPPVYNFVELPVATGRDQFWIEKYGAHGETAHGPLDGGHGSADHGDHDGHGEHEEHHIHLPSPSLVPFVVALGMFAMFLGVIFNFVLSAVGILIIFIGVYSWTLEPVDAPESVSTHA